MNNGFAFLDSFTMKNLMIYAVAFGIAFFAALWIGLILWVLRDIRSRTRDPFMIILSVFFVIVLFLPGSSGACVVADRLQPL